MKYVFCILGTLCLSVLILSGCSGSAETAAPLIPATKPVSELSSTAPNPTAANTPAPKASVAPVVPAATEAPASQLRLYLSGNRLPLNTPCEMIDGAVMVPVAEVLDAFNRDIECTADGDTLTINDASRGNVVVLRANDKSATLNDKAMQMEAPALLTDSGVMLMELSAFRLLFDADNKFIEEHGAAYIVESGLC